MGDDIDELLGRHLGAHPCGPRWRATRLAEGAGPGRPAGRHDVPERRLGSQERAGTRRIDRAWPHGGRSGRFGRASPRV